MDNLGGGTVKVVFLALAYIPSVGQLLCVIPIYARMIKKITIDIEETARRRNGVDCQNPLLTAWNQACSARERVSVSAGASRRAHRIGHACCQSGPQSIGLICISLASYNCPLSPSRYDRSDLSEQTCGLPVISDG